MRKYQAALLLLAFPILLTACNNKQALTPQDHTPTASTNQLSTDASPSSHFIDLEEVPTKEMIEDLVKIGVFEPTTTAGKFHPYETLTRGEYITYLYKSYNRMQPVDQQLRFTPESEQIFPDVPPTHPAYNYVQSMANTGYSIGYTDGTFKSDKPITREEMVAIKVGLDHDAKSMPLDNFNYAKVDQSWGFGDTKTIDKNFIGYIAEDKYDVGEHGGNIVRAFGKTGNLKPKTPVLRYQAAATLWQIGWDNHLITARQIANSEDNKLEPIR